MTPAATFTIAAKSSSPLTVNRLGYGGMQLTGAGIWGMPDDIDNALSVLRAAVEAGVNFIDTADAYGPHSNEELIRTALHPYDGVTIATKGGLVRTGPGAWHSLGRPEYLRQCVEMSLRRLGVDHVDLWQLHRVDSTVPLADQVGELAAMQSEGKIRHLGLSEVDVPTLQAALELAPIASVQNRFNVLSTGSQPVLDFCADNDIAFIPWFPLKNSELAGSTSEFEQNRFDVIARIAASLAISPVQLALAWLLHQPACVLPIPGTKSLAHLAENMAAANVVLPSEALEELNSLGRPD